MIYDQLLRSIQKAQEDYARINTRLGTQKKIQSPSEDVMGATRALDYELSITSNDQFQRNINGATTNLNLTSTALSSIDDILSQVKAIALASAAGSQDPSTSAAESLKTAQLRDQLLSLANTEVNGRYLFSGFRTTTLAYNTVTYDYQGDGGVINVPIDRGDVIPINVTGNGVFSVSLSAPYVKQTANGLNVHYTPGAGTTIDVEIRDAADTTVLDTFSFSNMIQMSDLLATAVGADDVDRIQALLDPFGKVQTQIMSTQSVLGARLSTLNDQSDLLVQNSNTLKSSLSSIMDVDTAETAMQLQKTDTTLQALYASSAKILSQSLLDFLM
jgi:flagellar hook-associated protein 3 FlgL